MDLLLQDRNKIFNFVGGLIKNKPEGGVNFFDKMDEFVRDPKNISMVYHLINKIKQDQGQKFNLIITGKFGDWVYNLIKKGDIKIDGVVIHVSGSLRSSIKNKTFQIINGKEDDAYNKNFILLDDSYYSGSTKREIDKHLSKYNSRIIKTYVFYDGGFTRKPDVYSVYRYYDYNSNEILPIKKLLEILNIIDEPNIPHDVIENQIMKGQIRSVKELLNEIQILKTKFKLAGSGNVNIKQYGYKREYENKKIKKYKEHLNEKNEEEYYTFDDLAFLRVKDIPEDWNTKRANMRFKNGYLISAAIGKGTNSTWGKNMTYEVLLFDPDNEVMGNVLNYQSKESVTELMITLQKIPKRKKTKRFFTEVDPYGEEPWEVDEKNDNDFSISVIKLWYKYKQEGRNKIREMLVGKDIIFHTKSKKVKVYKGRINGFLPMLSKRSNDIIILFNTLKYGILEVDNNYPIVIKDLDINEKVKWYNKGKLDIDPYEEENWNEFNIGDKINRNSVMCYFWDDWRDSKHTDINNPGNWKKSCSHDDNEIYTITAVDYCENIKGYTGQIVKIGEHWPWFQTTNLKRV